MFNSKVLNVAVVLRTRFGQTNKQLCFHFNESVQGNHMYTLVHSVVSIHTIITHHCHWCTVVKSTRYSTHEACIIGHIC